MSQKVYLAILKIGAIASFLCVFFVFKGLLFPYITSKQIPFNILTELLLVFWLAFIIKYPQWNPFKGFTKTWPVSLFIKPKKPAEADAAADAIVEVRDKKNRYEAAAKIPVAENAKSQLITFSLIAFFTVILVSCFTGVDFHMSFWSNAERMLGVYHILHFFILYLVAITVFRDWHDWLTVFAALLIAAVGVALGSLPTGSPAYSTLGNTLYTAVFMIFAFYFVLFLFFHKDGKDEKKGYPFLNWFYFLAIPFLYLQFYKVNKAGSTVGLLMGAATFIFLFGIINKRRAFRLVSWILTAAMIGIIALALVFHANPIFANNRFLSRINVNRPTFQTRLLSWESGVKDFHNHWLLGTGFGNYAITFDKYFQAKFYNYSKTETYFDRAHNNVVDLTSTTGILGILAYLSIFVAAGIFLIRILRRGRIKPVEFCLLASLLVAYFIQNLDVFDSFVTYLCLIIVLAYLHWLGNTEQDRGNTRALLAAGEQKGLPDREIFALIGAGLVVAFTIYNYAIVPMQTFAGVIQGQLAFNSGNLLTGEQLYKEALANNNPISRDSRSMLERAIADYAWDISKLPEAQAADIIAFGIQTGEKNLANNPKDSLMNMELARVYDAGFKIVSDNKLRSVYAEGALDHINQSIAASPQRIPVYFIKAQIQIGQGDIDGSIATLEYAKSIKPDFYDTDCQLAQIYLIEKNEYLRNKAATSSIDAIAGKAWSSMDSCLSHNGASNLAVTEVIKESIDHYTNQKDVVKITALYEQLIQYDNNADYYVQLARLYNQQGLIDRAIAAAEQAGKINPKKWKADADDFIKQLKNQK
jgi:O-antigen ligase/tetratricopeptide (TPR) repeat protein